MGKKQVNDFDISGKVLEVGNVERFSDKFSKRTLIMEVFTRRFPNEMPIDFVNESMKQIDDIRNGDWVTINFQLKSFTKRAEDAPVRRFVTIEGIACYRE